VLLINISRINVNTTSRLRGSHQCPVSQFNLNPYSRDDHASFSLYARK
jgi:hypothetical protein